MTAPNIVQNAVRRFWPLTLLAVIVMLPWAIKTARNNQQ